MTTVNDILTTAERIAPLHTQAEWDNSGLLAGSPDMPVTRVLLALDITREVVRQAHEIGAELIISHHPVIFDPLRALERDSAPYLLAKYDIAALCLHTNLDRAESGVNTALANAIGLRDIRLYPDDFFAVGTVDAADARGFAALLKRRLGAPDVRYTPGQVHTVAVSSGGGGEGVEQCKRYGCDAFVTGEIKHHQWLYAREHGIAAFDVGHFCSEDVVIRPLCEQLTLAHPETQFIISDRIGCPYIV